MGNCYNIDMDRVNRVENSIDSILSNSNTDYSCRGKYNNEQIKYGLREDCYGRRQSSSNDYILSNDFNKFYKGTFRHY